MTAVAGPGKAESQGAEGTEVKGSLGDSPGPREAGIFQRLPEETAALRLTAASCTSLRA